MVVRISSATFCLVVHVANGRMLAVLKHYVQPPRKNENKKLNGPTNGFFSLTVVVVVSIAQSLPGTQSHITFIRASFSISRLSLFLLRFDINFFLFFFFFWSYEAKFYWCRCSYPVLSNSTVCAHISQWYGTFYVWLEHIPHLHTHTYRKKRPKMEKHQKICIE